MVLNAACKRFFPAVAQVQLHVSPNLCSFCLLNCDTHVVVFTSILLYTPVTSLPDTSDDIILQQRMAVFILFTGDSLQKNHNHQLICLVSRLSSAYSVLHWFKVGVFIFAWPWRYHWVTPKLSFEVQWIYLCSFLLTLQPHLLAHPNHAICWEVHLSHFCVVMMIFILPLILVVLTTEWLSINVIVFGVHQSFSLKGFISFSVKSWFKYYETSVRIAFIKK